MPPSTRHTNRETRRDTLRTRRPYENSSKGHLPKPARHPKPPKPKRASLNLEPGLSTPPPPDIQTPSPERVPAHSPAPSSPLSRAPSPAWSRGSSPLSSISGWSQHPLPLSTMHPRVLPAEFDPPPVSDSSLKQPHHGDAKSDLKNAQDLITIGIDIPKRFYLFARPVCQMNEKSPGFFSRVSAADKWAILDNMSELQEQQQAQVERLSAALRECRRTTNEDRRRVSRLRDEREEARKERDQYWEEKNGYLKCLSGMEEERLELVRERADLVISRSAQIAERDTWAKEKNDLTEQVAETRSAQIAERDTWTKEKKDLTEQAAESARRAAELSEQVDELKRKVEGLEEANRAASLAAEEESNGLARKTESLSAERDCLVNEVAILKQTIARHEAKNRSDSERADMERQKWKDSEVEVSKETAAKARKIVKLEIKNKVEAEQAKAERVRLHTRQAELKEELSALQRDLVDSQARIKADGIEFNAEKKKLSGDLQKAEAEVERLSKAMTVAEEQAATDLEKVRHERDRLFEVHSRQEAETHKMQDTITGLKEQSTADELELILIRASYAKLTKEKEDMQLVLKTNKEKVESLQENMETERSVAASDRAERNRAVAKASALEGQLSAAAARHKADAIQASGSVKAVQAELEDARAETEEAVQDARRRQQALIEARADKQRLDRELAAVSEQHRLSEAALMQAQGEKRKLQVERNEMWQEVTTRRAAAESSRGELMAARNVSDDRARLLSDIAGLTWELREARASAGAGQQRVARLKDELDRVKAELFAAETGLQRAERERDEARTDKADIASSLQTSRKSNRLLEAENRALSLLSDTDGLRAELDAVKSQKSQILREKLNAEVQSARANEQWDVARLALATAETHLDRATANISMLRDDIAGLEADKASLEAIKSWLDTENASLEASKMADRRMKENLQASLHLASTKARTSAQEADKLRTKLDEAEAIALDLQTKLEEAGDLATARELEITDLKHKEGQLAELDRRIRAELHNARVRIENAERSAQESQNDRLRLEGQLEVAKQSANAYSEACSELEQKQIGLEDQIAILRGRNAGSESLQSSVQDQQPGSSVRHQTEQLMEPTPEQRREQVQPAGDAASTLVGSSSGAAGAIANSTQAHVIAKRKERPVALADADPSARSCETLSPGQGPMPEHRDLQLHLVSTGVEAERDYVDQVLCWTGDSLDD